MKIGIIFTSYNTLDYLADSLAPWIAAREQRLDGHDFTICAVNVPFAGFPNESEDGTRAALLHYLHADQIDHVITEPENIPETEARGAALKWLKDQDIDIVWQVDADEFYTTEEINRIIAFIELNPWIVWFHLCLKNYVFDDKTYLVDPFTPARIHRIRSGGFEATSFSADNDIAYRGLLQSAFPSMTIPQSVAWIKHLTWQNDLRSKRKVEYQMTRWGDACSFRWDEARGLIFNPALPTPKTATASEKSER